MEFSAQRLAIKLLLIFVTTLSPAFGIKAKDSTADNGVSKVTRKESPPEDSTMDHSQHASGMDMETMDSGIMDHSQHGGMQMDTMDSGIMNHSQHGEMQMDTMDSGIMDHSQHGEMQMETADSASMDHSNHGGMNSQEHSHGMRMDLLSMVMYENKGNIPKDCLAISEDISITVKAGRSYSSRFNGTMFGFDNNSWHVPGCSRITVTFVNEDDIRHQWMVHGLPKYIYPQGMFHMELNRRGETTGTFIVPGDDRTYLVHCDMAQHMERGMKAQLVVGQGSGDLPSIPGISGAYIQPAP